MPVRAGFKDEELQFLYPTSQWQTQPLEGGEIKNWKVAMDRFYIKVEIESGI
jgi:hypothetical protein